MNTILEPSRNPDGVDALIEAWQSTRSERALGALLHRYQRFLHGEASWAVMRFKLDPDDAAQEARLAFIRALEDYDSTRETSVMGYTRRIIRWRLQRMVATRDVVARPCSWASDYKAIRTAIEAMEAEGIAHPTSEQIAARLDGYTVRRVANVLQGISAVSVEKPIGDDIRLGDTLPSPEEQRPDVLVEERLDSAGVRAAVEAALAKLPPRRAQITRRVIIDGVAPADVARELGLHRQGISLHVRKAVEQLQHMLAADPRVREVIGDVEVGVVPDGRLMRWA